MHLKSSLVTLLVPPLLVATLVHGRPLIRCHATDASSLTAGNCDSSECCPQEEKAHSPKPKGKTVAPRIDPERQIVFQVEGLKCPAVKGIGCGHMLRGVLVSLDKIVGVEASAANYTGTMIRISVAPATDRNKVAEAARKVLTEEDRKAVPLTGADFKRALDREEWRDADRIGELSAIEFHTVILHRVKTFAKVEKIDKDASYKLIKIAEQQWERISEEAKNDGTTQPEEWANRCIRSLPILLERVKDVLTAEQVERFKQTLTGQCRDGDRPEAPRAPTREEKAPREQTSSI